jgi:hypothetical protein
VIAGAMVNNGIFKLHDNETISSFLARHGGLVCSDEMRKDYNNGKAVDGINIHLHRNNEVIILNVKNGNSYFNTINLLHNDRLFVKYENNMKAKFYYFNNIFTLPSHRLGTGSSDP